MTCDHTVKQLALAPIHEIQNRKPTENIIGQSMVTTGSWYLAAGLQGHFVKCTECGKATAMQEAVNVSFAGKLAVRWDADNQLWRWRET